MQLNRLAPLALLLPLLACGNTPPADAGMSDVPTGNDVPVGGDAGTDAPTADVPADSGGGQCGSERPDISGITGTEGLVIGADGTIYYSQAGAIGRMQPGMPQEDAWVTLTGASTVWGLTIDGANRRLFAGSPATRIIYAVDLNAATPTATTFLANAGAPNGLTFGTDGFLYYSDFGGGHVYRVSSAGVRTRVTTATIAQPNGVAFGPDGALYVDSYMGGTLLRLTLTDGMETARTVHSMGLGNPDGLAFDSTGAIYFGDNGRGRLLRAEADGTGVMSLRGTIPQAANVEFGHGALSCSDIYVASGGVLVRYEMGTVTGADVPWHH